MPKVRITPEIDAGLYQTCKDLGINQWSQIMSEALVKRIASQTQEKRIELNLAQKIYYEEAMRLITSVLMEESRGHKMMTTSIEFAQEHARKLTTIGYFTNAAELLKDAGERIVKQR